jgi:hypothetical protein
MVVRKRSFEDKSQNSRCRIPTVTVLPPNEILGPFCSYVVITKYVEGEYFFKLSRINCSVTWAVKQRGTQQITAIKEDTFMNNKIG